MSIEAMKLALAALETCRIRSVSDWSVEDITPKNVTAAIAALRTAIQQAEAQQPAAPEPVLTVEKEPDYWSGGHFHKGSKPHINPMKVWSLPIGTKLYTHPAPQIVLDDVVRDAEWYRLIRDGSGWPAVFAAHDAPEPLRGDDLDAAMLAAKDSK